MIICMVTHAGTILGLRLILVQPFFVSTVLCSLLDEQTEPHRPASEVDFRTENIYVRERLGCLPRNNRFGLVWLIRSMGNWDLNSPICFIVEKVNQQVPLLTARILVAGPGSLAH